MEDAFEQKLSQTQAAAAEGQKSVKKEAIGALVALGYSSSEALRAIGDIALTDELGVEDILKAALKNMALM